MIRLLGPDLPATSGNVEIQVLGLVGVHDPEANEALLREFSKRKFDALLLVMFCLLSNCSWFFLFFVISNDVLFFSGPFGSAGGWSERPNSICNPRISSKERRSYVIHSLSAFTSSVWRVHRQFQYGGLLMTCKSSFS